jgi:putative tryptophan/tyrosine transport system substrate-binding protein
MEHRGSRLSRRQFVVGAGVSAAGFGLLAGCGRLPWQAEPPAKVYRLGFLSTGLLEAEFEALLQSLHERGYVQGQNIVVEYRTAKLVGDRLPVLAAELVQLPVDAIVAAGTPAHLAAARATGTIPIITLVGDPVGDGLAASLARPGGNVTGLTSLDATLAAKRLELLKETVPRASRIAVLWRASNQSKAAEFRETQTAAQILGLELISLEVGSPEELEPAFAPAHREGADALVVLGDGLTYTRAAQIVALAAQQKLPALYEGKEFVDVGGLMSYGPSLTAAFRRAAYYVDRILKGAKPADLPVEQPMTFEFVINLKTAAALGLTFPNEILLQVTEVIQ